MSLRRRGCRLCNITPVLLEEGGCDEDPVCRDCGGAKLLRYPTDSQVKVYCVPSKVKAN